MNAAKPSTLLNLSVILLKAYDTQYYQIAPVAAFINPPNLNLNPTFQFMKKKTNKPAAKKAVVAIEGVKSKISATVAQNLVVKINAGIYDIKDALFELYSTNGWAALGYASWKECATKEFKESKSYLYRKLNQAKLSKLLKVDISEPEARILNGYSEDEVIEVYAKAAEAAEEVGVPTIKILADLKTKTKDKKKAEALKNTAIAVAGEDLAPGSAVKIVQTPDGSIAMDANEKVAVHYEVKPCSD